MFEPYGVNSTFVGGLNIVVTSPTNTTVQIATTANPTFNNMVLTGPSVKSLLYLDGVGNVAALTLGANTFAYGTNAGSNNPVAGSFTTATGMVFTYGASTIQVDTPQPLTTAASPTFSDVTLTGLAANRVVVTGVSGVISVLAAMGNGQLVIGNGGNAPSVATPTGSASLIITTGAGTLGFDTVQPITTSSSPTFSDVTLSSLTAGRPVITGASGLITTLTLASNQYMSNFGGTLTATSFASNLLTFSYSSGTTNINMPSTAVPVLAGVCAGTQSYSTGTASQVGGLAIGASSIAKV